MANLTAALFESMLRVLRSIDLVPNDLYEIAYQ